MHAAMKPTNAASSTGPEAVPSSTNRPQTETIATAANPTHAWRRLGGHGPYRRAPLAHGRRPCAGMVRVRMACTVGSTRDNRAVARFVVAIVLPTVAAGCGGDEPRQGIATTTMAGADTGGRPGKLVTIGAGRSLFVHCVGSGNPAVVLETGFGADASQWQAVQPELKPQHPSLRLWPRGHR